jgi:hypothetical protein
VFTGKLRKRIAFRWIQTDPTAEQLAFNLKRWKEILADREIAKLPHLIETDRHGHILMSPPPVPHSQQKTI